MKRSLEPPILTQISKELSKGKGKNKDLAAELDLTKQSMTYLSIKKKDLQDQMHQDSSMNSTLNAFLKTPPQPVASAGAVLHV